MERIKCIQQLDNKTSQTFFETCKLIIKTQGLSSFMRGFCVTFNRDVLGFGIYFSYYYYMKDLGEKYGVKSNIYLLTIGGLAGIKIFKIRCFFMDFYLSIRYNKNINSREYQLKK
jgi:hypothetical protein